MLPPSPPARGWATWSGPWASNATSQPGAWVLRASAEWQLPAAAVGYCSGGPAQWSILLSGLGAVPPGLRDACTLLLDRLHTKMSATALAPSCSRSPAFVCVHVACRRGLTMNAVTYNPLLVACEAAGRLDVALGLLAEMRERGISRDAYTYSCLISSCKVGGPGVGARRAGRWAEFVGWGVQRRCGTALNRAARCCCGFHLSTIFIALPPLHTPPPRCCRAPATWRRRGSCTGRCRRMGWRPTGWSATRCWRSARRRGTPTLRWPSTSEPSPALPSTAKPQGRRGGPALAVPLLLCWHSVEGGSCTPGIAMVLQRGGLPCLQAELLALTPAACCLPPCSLPAAT